MSKKIDKRVIDNSVHLDANEKAFFTRQLEHIKSQTYDVLYPEYSATRLIPVSTEAGPGAKTITYRQWDAVGTSKILASYADDLPRVDVDGKEFTSPVRPHGNAYGYNVDEIEEARMAGVNLTARKALASRQSYEQFVNKIAWFANGSNSPEYAGLIGLLYAPNITTGTAHTGGTSGKVKWAEKNVDEILKDMNDTVQGIIDLTKGVERPDTILLPLAQYGIISTKRLGDGSDTTILDFFLRTNPFINTIEGIFELKDVSPKPSAPTGAGTTDVMLVYKRDPMKLTLEIPKPYTQLPVEPRNLEFIVNTHSKCGGVIVYYPLSVSILEGI